MKKNNTSNTEEDKPPSPDQAQTGSFFVASQPELFFPAYFEKKLTLQQQKLYSQNGQSELIKLIKVKIVKQLESCQELWEEFSPHQTIFDTWSFRHAFWLGYKYEPYFVVLKTGTQNLAILPLWYEDDKKSYRWFGSWWQEDNTFLTKNELLIPILLALCPVSTELNALSQSIPTWVKETSRVEDDDPKYILRLDGLESSADYLERFKKKKRYNLRRDYRLITEQEPKIIIDRFEDLNHLICLSTNRFAQKGEEVDWEDPRRVETFRQVIRLGQRNNEYQIRMISIEINNQIAAVDLIGLYRGCYYPLKCGYDVTRFPGIGNYTNLFEIDDALSLGMKRMDFLEIGYGWKESWFESVPLFKFCK
ncbi:GNAT family N-acetyltransferase [Patescibacteria group bacterium]|nr:GNAT family N-acetyltransferase [Patescibacteria group bacterium]